MMKKSLFDDIAAPEYYEMGPAVERIRYGDKFIQEYDTEELRSAYAEHLGPCRVCGQIGSPTIAAMSRDQLVDIWTIDRKLQLGRPELNASLDNIASAGICDNCFELKESTLKAMRKEAGIQRLHRKLLHLDIVPQEFFRCRFIDSDEKIMLVNPEHWEWARSWTPKQESAWITGIMGTGKTFMARCILNAQLAKGYPVGELSAVEFNRIARRKFYEWHEQRKIFGKVKILLIEDIDKAVWLPEGLSELFDLVDERYNNDRRTFVTTNMTIEKCTDLWKNAVPQNKSLPGTIQDRLKPIRRMEFLGKTHRKGAGDE